MFLNNYIALLNTINMARQRMSISVFNILLFGLFFLTDGYVHHIVNYVKGLILFWFENRKFSGKVLWKFIWDPRFKSTNSVQNAIAPFFIFQVVWRIKKYSYNIWL